MRIRNINMNGFDTGLNGVRILGVAAASAGSEVFIEDCLIDGNFGGTARGISDERTGGGELTVSARRSEIPARPGIAIIGGTRIDVTLDNVRVQNSNFGVAVGSNVKLMINRSVFSGSQAAGIESDPGGEINVDNSVSSNNVTGVQVIGWSDRPAGQYRYRLQRHRRLPERPSRSATTGFPATPRPALLRP